ncbi:MAG TPA: uracil-DNA glycosylase [Afifellaceae bacterium]|nr:uracil-DNA glycosylase [Afifellaceae bacterium]
MKSSDRPASISEPPPDCPLCPRLAALRGDLRQRQPGWHNAPVPTFGADDAPLLIVGLAPGLKGANRTGRPFTGDFAGELLYPALIRHGFAAGSYEARPDDTLRLRDAAITNAVRCVPPANKPTGEEVRTCRTFLRGAIAGHRGLRAILALGRIAHDSTVRALGLRLAGVPFVHGARHPIGEGLWLYDSYHCSRYNTSTRVLTPEMFDAVVARIRADLDMQTL